MTRIDALGSRVVSVEFLSRAPSLLGAACRHVRGVARRAWCTSCRTLLVRRVAGRFPSGRRGKSDELIFRWRARRFDHPQRAPSLWPAYSSYHSVQGLTGGRWRTRAHTWTRRKKGARIARGAAERHMSFYTRDKRVIVIAPLSLGERERRDRKSGHLGWPAHTRRPTRTELDKLAWNWRSWREDGRNRCRDASRNRERRRELGPRVPYERQHASGVLLRRAAVSERSRRRRLTADDQEFSRSPGAREPGPSAGLLLATGTNRTFVRDELLSLWRDCLSDQGVSRFRGID
jgi:hypothetical protein